MTEQIDQEKCAGEVLRNGYEVSRDLMAYMPGLFEKYKLSEVVAGLLMCALNVMSLGMKNPAAERGECFLGLASYIQRAHEIAHRPRA